MEQLEQGTGGTPCPPAWAVPPLETLGSGFARLASYFDFICYPTHSTHRRFSTGAASTSTHFLQWGCPFIKSAPSGEGGEWKRGHVVEVVHGLTPKKICPLQSRGWGVSKEIIIQILWT